MTLKNLFCLALLGCAHAAPPDPVLPSEQSLAGDILPQQIVDVRAYIPQSARDDATRIDAQGRAPAEKAVQDDLDRREALRVYCETTAPAREAAKQAIAAWEKRQATVNDWSNHHCQWIDEHRLDVDPHGHLRNAGHMSCDPVPPPIQRAANEPRPDDGDPKHLGAKCESN